MAFKSKKLVNTLMNIIKTIGFVAYITIGGTLVTAAVLCIVPVLQWMFGGVPL